MTMEKKITISVSISLIVLFIISIGIAVGINMHNKKLKEDTLYIYIYQYETIDFKFDSNKAPILYDKILFDESTNKDFVVTSLDNKYYNHIVVKDGVLQIIDASCKNHVCMKDKLTTKKNILNPMTISCLPSGLYICLKGNNIVNN